jgi:hypothetical protein
MLIFGEEALNAVIDTGVLNDRQKFKSTISELSSKLKRMPDDPDNCKQMFCEMQTLLGYVNLPDESWDMEKEINSLAHGGNEHGLLDSDWEATFKYALTQIKDPLSFPPTRKEDFAQYVLEGLWVTSGSSSVGEVTWTRDSKTGHFKARKNMLFDIYTPDEILAMCYSWDGTLVSRPFVKNELGKVRLAVASGLEEYIHESFVAYRFGHQFKNWFGITLDETPMEQHNRNHETSDQLASGLYAFAYDYANFDHQPTTNEIVWILEFVKSCVGPQDAEIIRIIDLVIKALKSSVIKGQIDGKDINVRQTGGLASGIRWTSIDGNVWNSVITWIALMILKLLTGKKVSSVALRGDDTLITAQDPGLLVILRWIYNSLNAQGKNAKIGINQKCGEFLRNTISSEGVRGWTCRGIGGVTQRKPWSSSPWSPNAEVTTIVSNIYLLERRSGLTLSKLHNAAKQQWSKYMSQSYHFLSLPTHLGGLGLYTWLGWTPDGKLPLVEKPIVNVQNLQPTVYSWIHLPPAVSQMTAQASMSAKMQLDDIPGTQQLFSYGWLRSVRQRKINWVMQEPKLILPKTVEYPIGKQTNWPKFEPAYIPSNKAGFPTVITFLREYNLLKLAARRLKYQIHSLMDYLKYAYRDFHSKVVAFEHNGWHRTDAINLALGEIPTEPIKQVHPLLACFVKKHIANSGIRFWKGRKTIGFNLYKHTTEAVSHYMVSAVRPFYAF